MQFFNPADLLLILPLIALVLSACVILLIDVFLPEQRRAITPWLALAALLTALLLAVIQLGASSVAFKGMAVIDGFSVMVNIFALATGILSFTLTYDYLKQRGLNKGEYYVMMLFSIAGVMLMGMVADLIVVFLALELLSIPLYIMAAFATMDDRSKEAGLKYFLLGAFAGGFILYGIAFIYGATASTNLEAVFIAIQGGVDNPIFLLVGAGLILVGLGFKVAAVPFHMWTPDVYEGAPTPATAYMAVAAKVGGFAALLRVFVVAFPSLGADLAPVIWGVVAATLIVGNVAAIAQSNIKRLLAYSSISHAGFILMAFIGFGDDAVFRRLVAAALFYLIAFGVTSFGSWGVVIALEQAEGKGLQLSDYAGLGKKYPALALAMLIFMLSFTGIPPTLGFAGKFYLFSVVIEAGYPGLAVLAMLASIVSAYYYLRLVVIMYMQEGEPEAQASRMVNLTTAFGAIGAVVLFFLAEPLLNWTADALLMIF
jgi:NADH-quinone oxidoreductase subunit N